MEMKVRSEKGVSILELAGRFDAYATPSVVEWLNETAATPPANIVVNLAQVHFIDSTGLATLVQGMKRCRQNGGDLRLCHLQQPVRIIFELTCLDRAFQIFEDEVGALESFHAYA